ncbi:hypothetical protein GQ600_13539 [Phytophthora cactorum]|nr:hypothetical protein GQ600_13539 [Phytophthora cactorum]
MSQTQALRAFSRFLPA